MAYVRNSKELKMVLVHESLETMRQLQRPRGCVGSLHAAHVSVLPSWVRIIDAGTDPVAHMRAAFSQVLLWV
ncbi:hypothetical protein CLCR_07855 [Cladophialophora carrionii]|uniref:Uncharacterized protein n=1 Tax=Cladophialophora carrionii TaxID=86049 RepID=A0A1C1CQK0_9EURO|nr:hypothetical protein CLCR_07855 [Cladophialophora carrionii]